jgi:glycerophosphoryl diester phosphodiesterase
MTAGATWQNDLQSSAMISAAVLTLSSLSTVPAWRSSLQGCWTNTSCQRALTVSHGGDWNLTYPYGSFEAFKLAQAHGADAVKGDFRWTADGKGVVVHSSPIEIYESLNCVGKQPEKMTSAEVTGCRMLPQPSAGHFITADAFLDWAKGRINVMLCLKYNDDLKNHAAVVQGAISTLVAAGAQNRTFLEIKVGELLQYVQNSSGWEQVYYLAELGSAADLQLMLKAPSELLKRTFMWEFDKKFNKWGIGDIKTVIQRQLHPAGVRALAATSEVLATVGNHEALWQTDGFDVVYTYNLKNAVVARTKVDEARGVNPP